MDLEERVLQIFLWEGNERLAALREGLDSLSRGEAEPAVLEAATRHAHTIKGTARLLSEIEMSEAASTIEGIFRPHHDAGTTPSAALVEEARALVDLIAERVKELEAGSG